MNSKALMKAAGYSTTKDRESSPTGRIMRLDSGIPKDVESQTAFLKRLASDLGVDYSSLGVENFKIAIRNSDDPGPEQRFFDVSELKVGTVTVTIHGNWGFRIISGQEGRYLKYSFSTSLNKYFMNWTGNTCLVSDKPFDPALVAEINKAKQEELEKSREKRRTTVKNCMDAVRLLLQENGISCSRIAGAVRVHADMCCGIDFCEVKDTTKVKVVFVYNAGGNVSREITVLDLASPEFGEHALIIIHNFKSMWSIITGEKQLKPMPFKITTLD